MSLIKLSPSQVNSISIKKLRIISGENQTIILKGTGLGKINSKRYRILRKSNLSIIGGDISNLSTKKIRIITKKNNPEIIDGDLDRLSSKKLRILFS